MNRVDKICEDICNHATETADTIERWHPSPDSPEYKLMVELRATVKQYKEAIE
jgi:hypothetical protein